METKIKLDNPIKKKIVFLLLFSFFEFVCLLTGSVQLGGIISLILLYVTVFWDRHLPLCVYVITNTLGVNIIGVVSTINAIFLSMLALYFIFRNNHRFFRKYILITLYFFVILVISYNTGFNSRLDIAIKMVVACLIILQIASCDAQERLLIVSAVLCCGISMALFVAASLSTGGGVDISTRLLFNENSKSLATALAPVVITAVYALFFRRGKNVLFTVGLLISVAILTYLVVLTYSRGVLIALIISISYLLLRFMGKGDIRNYLFLFLFITTAFYLLSIMQFDDYLMYKSLEGGNGRTEIWADFYQQLKETNTLAFGFGPGLTKEISRLDFYSHSTILDYLFCYGIAGFIYVLYLLLNVIFNLFKTKFYYYQGLFILSTIMFSTHGSAGTLLFNVILGLCMSVVVYDRNEAVVKKTIV